MPKRDCLNEVYAINPYAQKEDRYVGWITLSTYAWLYTRDDTLRAFLFFTGGFDLVIPRYTQALPLCAVRENPVSRKYYKTSSFRMDRELLIPYFKTRVWALQRVERIE